MKPWRMKEQESAALNWMSPETTEEPEPSHAAYGLPVTVLAGQEPRRVAPSADA